MRRHDPDRAADARRSGMAARVRDALGCPQEAADALVADWAHLAAAAGLSPAGDGYWSSAEAWLAAEVERRLAGRAPH